MVSFLVFSFYFSKGEFEVEADEPAVARCDAVGVGEAADEVDTEEFQYVFDTDAVFHVGYVADGASASGEEVEACGVAVGGVVAAGEGAVEDVEAYDFAETEPVDEGYAVEYPAFEVVGGEESGVAVHDEFHGLHGVEGCGGEEEVGVAGGDIETGIGSAVPDGAGDEASVDVAEGGEPDAFLGGEGGGVEELGVGSW